MVGQDENDNIEEQLPKIDPDSTDSVSLTDMFRRGKLHWTDFLQRKSTGDDIKAEQNETESIRDIVNDEQIKPQWGTANYNRNRRLEIAIPAPAGITLRFDIIEKKRLEIGRYDQKTNYVPDIDLPSMGFMNSGISRKHAALEWQDDHIIVIDLSSKNGTRLNGMRLIPHQPRILRHHDEIQLGMVPLRILFVDN